MSGTACVYCFKHLNLSSSLVDLTLYPFLFFKKHLISFCDSVRRAQLIRGVTVNKSMLQKDGVTLYPSGVLRYVETVIPPIRLAIDQLSGRKSEDSNLSLEEVISSHYSLADYFLINFGICFIKIEADVESVNTSDRSVFNNVMTGTVTEAQEDAESSEDDDQIAEVLAVYR